MYRVWKKFVSFLTFTFVATDELRSVRKIYGWKNFARGDETTQIRKKEFSKNMSTFARCHLSNISLLKRSIITSKSK